jgi:hypothetical protein
LGLEDDGDREGIWRVLRGVLGNTVQRKFLGVVVAGV